VLRFVLVALPLVLLLLAAAAVAQELTVPPGAPSAGAALAGLAGPWQLGEWLLEATALAGLFLLVQGRGGSWWLDGLLTGGAAWVFRGPLLLLTMGRLSPLALRSWAPQVWWWLGSYLLVGLALGWLARRSGVET
jgi:hypothetical protein